jgi:heat shock protein HtpX
MTDIYSQQKRNRRVTAQLILVFFVIVVSLGLSIDVYTQGTLSAVRAPVATIIAASVAGLNGFVSYFYGSSLVLMSLGAEGLKFEDPTHKKLHNVVVEMALASGVPMPRVYVIADPSPNAFATGRTARDSAVVVTQGLLDAMTREELQAVVAHEMGHIKASDMLTMTVVAVLLGTVSLITDWAVRTWRFGGVRRGRGLRGRGVHPLALLVIGFFVLLSPLVSRVIAMAVSRTREYQADASSAEFTRNPLALASALEKIRDSTSPLRAARRGTAHLFISDPLKRKIDEKEGFFADVFSTHPPIDRRIERLRRMGYERAGAGTR